ncbi:hypothetical protein PGTUg99_018701 [Puccinia graminis f. sp. tritici]|uniref:BZIP domain-containing protein n=1 Tax=Puccinia graminis f. sp. tritici TaxID=56615 RepID=A0A5B0RC77_PUCGR|nr:hypothetical protein PGTUg99_018701 [Puccinia graminis f. sp. tritici]
MKQPPNQLSHLNRPGNPLALLGLQQQGNLSVGLGNPPLLGQHQHSVEDAFSSQREDPGNDHSKLNPNQLSGAYGHHWDFGHSGHDDQHPENNYPSATALDYPGESSREFMSDVPANRPDQSFDFSSHPDSAYLQSQLNAVLPDANQGGSSLPGNSPHRAQFSTSLPSSKRKSNQARNHQKQSNFPPNGVGSQAQKNTGLDGHVQSRDTGPTSAPSFPGNVASTSSHVEIPEESPTTKRWKRKITDSRREQNRAHQKAFRERRELSARQKDLKISTLEARVTQHEVSGREQREKILKLQSQLASVDNLQSKQHPSSLPDYSQSYRYGTALPPNHQSLPRVENLELGGNRHFLPTIPNPNHLSGSSSSQWNPSNSAYVPNQSIFNSNPPEGSSKNYHSHYNHQGPSSER